MLPLFMKNRPSSSFDGTLQDLEASVFCTLSRKFARGVITTGSTMDAYVADLPNECPLEDAANAGKAITRPFTNDQAADVVDAALDDYRLVSPSSTPERPAKKARTSSLSEASRPSCTLPSKNDPMDEVFCTRLYSSGEEGKINPAHTAVRRSILEVRRTASGRIFFQCGCCKHRPRGDRVKQSTLAPQCIKGLYRAMIRFMMYHVPVCGDIPREIRELSPKNMKDITARKTKAYWVESALKMGLRDAEDGRGIVLCKTE